MKQLAYLYNQWEESLEPTISFYFLDNNERIPAPNINGFDDQYEWKAYKDDNGINNEEMELFYSNINRLELEDAFAELMENEYEISHPPHVLGILDMLGFKRLEPQTLG